MNIEIEKEQSFYLELGRRIRRARKKKHFTQEQLAGFLHLNRTSITNIEKGKQKVLIYTLVELAEKLEVSVNDLLPKSPQKTKEFGIDKLIEKNSSPEKREFLESVLSKARKG